MGRLKTDFIWQKNRVSIRTYRAPCKYLILSFLLFTAIRKQEASDIREKYPEKIPVSLTWINLNFLWDVFYHNQKSSKYGGVNFYNNKEH